MLIILEGPDGAGKSTLAKRLVKSIKHADPCSKIDVLHAKPPQRHPLDEYVRPLTSYRPNTGVHVICDRWHWGESIYPMILGRQTQYTSSVHRFTEWFLLSRGAVVIYLTAPDEILRKRLTTRGDDLITEDIIDQIRTAYTLFARSNTQLPTLTRSANMDDAFIDSLCFYAQTHEMRASRLNAFTTYVGSPGVKYLFLGDRRANIDYPNDPAFMPFLGRSGDFLIKNFHSVAQDYHYGFANACDVDDPWLLWRVLGKPKIIALGTNANIALNSVPGMSHGVVPHPQFIRRFHHHDGKQYGQLILKVLHNSTDELSWRPRVTQD